MAEIKIEKKTPVWPWILVVLIIIAVVAFFIFNDYDADDVSDDVATEKVDSTDTYRNDATDTYDQSAFDKYNAAMSQFDSYINDSNRIGTDTIYTKTAFHKLADLVVLKADQNNLPSSEALENLRGYAMQASETVNDMSISESLNAIGNDIASVVESIQDKNFPNLDSDVSKLKDISDKLDNNIALAKQQQNIQDFMMKSKSILNSMKR